MERAERERRAYDEDGVFEKSHRWHMAAGHALWAPNTARAERRFARIVRDAVRGGTALDVGCGFGHSSQALLRLGAERVHGVDVSRTAVKRAQASHADEPRLSFACADVGQPFEGTYDVICGRSVLHHIDFREFLVRALRENLNPGGALVFMEPVGTNVLSKLFHLAVRGAHTPDERPFTLADQRWLRRSFDDVELVPVNFLTFPVAILSSLLMRDKGPDNRLTRWADRRDVAIERTAPPALALTQARQVLVAIHSPVSPLLQPVDPEHAWHTTTLD